MLNEHLKTVFIKLNRHKQSNQYRTVLLTQEVAWWEFLFHTTVYWTTQLVSFFFADKYLCVYDKYLYM